MNKNQISDQRYLKEIQYKTADNLRARIQLHERFSTNAYPWFSWVFDHFELIPGMRIVEIGCGPAGLWQHNLGRIPDGAQPILGDLSEGMVQEARQVLNGRNFSFLSLDAQSLPCADGQLDLLVANHMLYHVPDINRAVEEISRVLKPGGRLIAATNGDYHMKELGELATEFLPGYKIPTSQARRFSLENGIAWLQPHFSSVQIHRYNSNLRVTEPQPLIDYVLSMWPFSDLQGKPEAGEIARSIQQRFEDQDSMLITKSQGLFSAIK